MPPLSNMSPSKRARSPLPPPDGDSTSPFGTPTAATHAQVKRLRLSMGTPSSADTSTSSSSHSASTSASAPSLVHSGTPSSRASGLASPSGSDSFVAGDESSIRSHTDGENDRSIESDVGSLYQPSPIQGSYKLGPPSSLLAQVSVKNAGNPQSPSHMYSSPPITTKNPVKKLRLSIGSPAPSSPLQVQHLPLPLLSHIFTALLVPRRCNRMPSIIPLPNLLLSLSLVRATLGSSSALSPREEVELRVLEGWVGSEAGKVMLAEAGDTGQGVKEEWAERGRRELRETEIGLGKGIILCQKHPHLVPFLHDLTIFQAEAASLQGNSKFAIKTLKRSLASASQSSFSLPLHRHYALLLTLANNHLTTSSSSSSTHALTALTLLQNLAAKHSHHTLVVIAQLSRLGILVREGSWRQARDLLPALGNAVGYIPPPPPPPKDGTAAKPDVKAEPVEPKTEPPPASVPPTRSQLEKQMYTHYLCLGSLVRNHLGQGLQATGMIKALHAILDEGTDGDAGLGGGVWEIPIGDKAPGSSPTKTMEQSLLVRFTPPHLVYILACLYTCVSKRDPTGKRPKKTIFADEGLRQLGATGEQEITYPPGSTSWSAIEWTATKCMLEGELRCEAVGVAIVRSDFDAAQTQLSDLISFTRSTALFQHFAPRITLLQAHLAQSLGRSEKALSYYRAAYQLARHPSPTSMTPSPFGGSPSSSADLALAAKLGEMGLMVGLGRLGEVREECEKVAKEAWGNAGQVGVEQAIKDGEGQDDVVLKIGGGLLTALMEGEILKSKKHLKVCLDFASSSSDNTARPLVLSLTAALFINTREKQSLIMLQTALQLARSLGKDGTGGNATFGLWLGQKYEHTLRRNGDEKKASEIAKLNAAHVKKLAELATKNELTAAAASTIE